MYLTAERGGVGQWPVGRRQHTSCCWCPVVYSVDGGCLQSSPASQLQRVRRAADCQTHRPAVPQAVSRLFPRVQRRLLDCIRRCRKPRLTVSLRQLLISRVRRSTNQFEVFVTHCVFSIIFTVCCFVLRRNLTYIYL